MTAAAIIECARADGVTLALDPAGKLKVRGNDAAVARWLPDVREHKTALVNLLSEPAAVVEDSLEPDRPPAPSHWAPYYAEWFAGIAEPRALVTLTQGQARAAVAAGLVSADLHRASVMIAYRSSLGVRGLLAVPRAKYCAFKVAEVLGDDSQGVTT